MDRRVAKELLHIQGWLDRAASTGHSQWRIATFSFTSTTRSIASSPG